MTKPISFSRNHFVPLEDLKKAKELFGDSVSNVIIEIFSYCNRRCAYCPVSAVDRISENKFMADSIFFKIVDDLSGINYKGRICLNLYNEPLAHRPSILGRISQIRKALPSSHIYFSSNGDFLTKEYLHELYASGLSSLYITLHPAKNKKYDDLGALNRMVQFSVRLGIPVTFESYCTKLNIQATFDYKGLTVSVFSINYEDYGQNRGGLMKNIPVRRGRIAPCNRPFSDFTVSYDGTVFPCCQLFADSDQHKKYAVGNIESFHSIFEAYTHKAIVRWRRSLLTFGPKEEPCNTCTESDNDGTEEEIKARKELYDNLVVARKWNLARVSSVLLRKPFR